MNPDSRTVSQWTPGLAVIFEWQNSITQTDRNRFPRSKAKVAFEVLQGEETNHEIAAKFWVHPTPTGLW